MEPKPVDVICFTHFHADHISGLPGMLLTMGNAERVEPVLLAGPRGLEAGRGSLKDHCAGASLSSGVPGAVGEPGSSSRQAPL